MEINQFAIHKIIDTANLPFSDKEYSRFKCGALSVAKKYGELISQNFCKQILSKNLIQGKEIVVFSSAYAYIPSAATLMTRYFIRHLNLWLNERELPLAMESKVVRKKKYADEYSILSKEDRERFLTEDIYYIDTNFTKDKIVLFLDDVHITGAHQKMIENVFNLPETPLPKEIWFLYFAKLENPAVAATFEGELNYAEIRDIRGIKTLAENDEFEYIIRTVRYILEASEADFYEYIRKRPFSEKEDIYFSALCEGYGEHPKYQANMTRLKMILHL